MRLSIKTANEKTQFAYLVASLIFFIKLFTLWNQILR